MVFFERWITVDKIGDLITNQKTSTIRNIKWVGVAFMDVMCPIVNWKFEREQYSQSKANINFITNANMIFIYNIFKI